MKSKLFFVFLLSVFLTFCSCKKESQPQTFVTKGNALGTTYMVKYINNSPLSLERSIDSIFEAFNQSMSTYRKDSDISKINNGDSTVVVDEAFKKVFALSGSIWKNTDGYFDPTIGVLINAYGFGASNQSAEVSLAQIDSLLQYIGWDKVSLQEDGTIVKQLPEIRFNFNAIAKGASVDYLADLMDANGVENYLIEVGGELKASGLNTVKNKSWVVGIQNPDIESAQNYVATASLKDRAMATSGNYRKFRIDSLTGTKYVHTINPKTGLAKQSNILSVSVLAPTCMESDGYATAFMAMPLEASIAITEELPQLESYIIYLENDQMKTYVSKGFDQFVIK